MYRHVASAPASSVPAERRGAVVGRFCKGCKAIYPRHALRHAGKPSYGKDHIGSPCPYEGRSFEPEAGWWEPAVELLAAVPEAPPAA
jgi:hypothetical protein